MGPQVPNLPTFGTFKTDFDFPGDLTGGGPPVPIPNTVVKPTRADDTWALGPGKIGRRQDYLSKAPLR